MMKVQLLIVLLLAVAWGSLCRAQATTCDTASCGCDLTGSLEGTAILLDTVGLLSTSDNTDASILYFYRGCDRSLAAQCGARPDTAVCKIGAEMTVIGQMDTVHYSVVSSSAPINVSALYTAEDSDVSSTVYLVCDETAFKPVFTHLYTIDDHYYFNLVYADLCENDYALGVDESSVISPSETVVTQNPVVTPTLTAPATLEPSALVSATSVSFSTSAPATEIASPSPPASTSPISISVSATSVHFSITSAGVPLASSAVPRPTNNKGDKDRKVILAVVLTIIGAIIIGIVAAIVVYFIWRKKHTDSYQKIPEM